MINEYGDFTSVVSSNNHEIAIAGKIRRIGKQIKVQQIEIAKLKGMQRNYSRDALPIPSVSHGKHVLKSATANTTHSTLRRHTSMLNKPKSSQFGTRSGQLFDQPYMLVPYDQMGGQPLFPDFQKNFSSTSIISKLEKLPNAPNQTVIRAMTSKSPSRLHSNLSS